MSGLSLRDPHLLGTLAVAIVCLGGVIAYLMTRRQPSEEEIERERRAELVESGRIIDGTVIDTSELDPQQSGRPAGLKLILYQYEIAGVVYECSQDVSALIEIVDIHDCRIGFPCSVRYNVHKPENSIVIAEGWSGLRTTANSVPIRRTVPRKSRPTAAPFL